MLAKRIIPCLDVKGGRVVKGVSFLKLRDAGDPVKCAIEYDKQKADELVFLDIVASHEERDILESFKRSVAGYIVKPVDYQKFVEAIRTIDLYWTLSELPESNTVEDHHAEQETSLTRGQ